MLLVDWRLLGDDAEGFQLGVQGVYVGEEARLVGQVWRLEMGCTTKVMGLRMLRH